MIAIVIVVVPIAIRVPPMLVFIPPAMRVIPAPFPRRCQFGPLGLRLGAVPAVPLRGAVQLMINPYNPFLAIVVSANSRCRSRQR